MKIYIGQLEGPFNAKEDLTRRILRPNNLNYDLHTLRIGIFSNEGHKVMINGIEFEIGKTGVLELNPLQLNRLYFTQAESASTFIDYMAI